MWTKLARVAVTVAKNRLQIANLSMQDYEDAAQAAEIGAIKGSRKSNEDKYIFVSAKNEALKEIIRNIFGKNPINTLSIDNEEIAESSQDFTKECPFSEQELIDFFYEHRSKKGDRGKKASKRDAYICKRLIEGAGNATIANELGISEDNLRKYRSDIRSSLRKVLEG